MWRDILLHNKDKILDRFDEWIREIEKIRTYVEQEDAENLLRYFKTAKDYRDGRRFGRRARYLHFMIYTWMFPIIRV